MIHVMMDIDETMVSVPAGINAKASAAMFEEVFHVQAHEELISNVGKTEMGIIMEILDYVGTKEMIVENNSSQLGLLEKAYRVWAQATERELILHPVRVLPGIPELLNALSKKEDLRLSLLSGNSQWRAEAKLKSGHLDTYFRDPETRALVGVFGNMASKREQLFDKVKKQATNQDRFIIVDDSLVGAKMARTHNLPMILVATGKTIEGELRAFTPNVFHDLGENRWQKAAAIIEAL